MPRKRRPNLRPLVPPLDLVLAVLSTTDLSAKQEGDSVVIGHASLTSRIDVVPPTNRESENLPIRLVVRVKTELPEEFGAMFAKPEMTAAINGMATLGALTVESGQTFVGSRLSIYEDAENLLDLHVGLIVSAAVGATDSLLGAVRRTVTGEGGKEQESAWSADDMDEVRKFLSLKCVCTTGGRGLTAEFPLRDGVVSSVMGDRHTALWQLAADHAHPEMGGGLFCLLEMPHQVKDEQRKAGSDLINMICGLLAGGASLVEQEGKVTPGSHVKGICNPAHGHGRFPMKSLGDCHLERSSFGQGDKVLPASLLLV